MDEIFDLPAHPLIVHAPVVLIPLAALGGLVIAISARWRERIGWIVVGLVAAATLAVLLAANSGQALKEALGATPPIEHHEAAGELVRLQVIAFLVVVAAFMVVHVWRGRWFSDAAAGVYVLRAAAVATILAGGLATYGTVRAGHTGAQAAWDGRVPGIGGTPAAAAPGTSEVAATVVSGTGDTAPAAGATDTSAAAVAVDPRTDGLDVGLGEWAVTLEAPSIRPGEVTFTVRNAGTVAHGFRVRAAGDGSDFEVRTETIPPGGSATLTVDLSVGTYEVDCFVEDASGEHDALGMEAIVEVRDDAPDVVVDVAAAPGATEAPGVPATGSVAIAGFAFDPPSLAIPAGTEVAWTNADPEVHTATADEGSFDSGSLDAGAAFTQRFDVPGTITYFCAIHPSMRGEVVVS